MILHVKKMLEVPILPIYNCSLNFPLVVFNVVSPVEVHLQGEKSFEVKQLHRSLE